MWVMYARPHSNCVWNVLTHYNTSARSSASGYTHNTHTRTLDTSFSEADTRLALGLAEARTGGKHSVWAHLRAHPTTIHLPQPARAYAYYIPPETPAASRYSLRHRRESTALRSPASRHSSRSQCSPAWALSCAAVHHRERSLQSACLQASAWAAGVRTKAL